MKLYFRFTEFSCNFRFLWLINKDGFFCGKLWIVFIWLALLSHPLFSGSECGLRRFLSSGTYWFFSFWLAFRRVLRPRNSVEIQRFLEGIFLVSFGFPLLDLSLKNFNGIPLDSKYSKNYPLDLKRGNFLIETLPRKPWNL